MKAHGKQNEKIGRVHNATKNSQCWMGEGKAENIKHHEKKTLILCHCAQLVHTLWLIA